MEEMTISQVSRSLGIEISKGKVCKRLRLVTQDSDNHCILYRAEKSPPRILGNNRFCCVFPAGMEYHYP